MLSGATEEALLRYLRHSHQHGQALHVSRKSLTSLVRGANLFTGQEMLHEQREKNLVDGFENVDKRDRSRLIWLSNKFKRPIHVLCCLEFFHCY